MLRNAHYTRATVEVSHFCPTCNKMTAWTVMDKRLGACKNEHPHPETKEKVEDTQGDLFR